MIICKLIKPSFASDSFEIVFYFACLRLVYLQTYFIANVSIEDEVPFNADRFAADMFYNRTTCSGCLHL